MFLVCGRRRWHATGKLLRRPYGFASIHDSPRHRVSRDRFSRNDEFESPTSAREVPSTVTKFGSLSPEENRKFSAPPPPKLARISVNGDRKNREKNPNSNVARRGIGDFTGRPGRPRTMNFRSGVRRRRHLNSRVFLSEIGVAEF